MSVKTVISTTIDTEEPANKIIIVSQRGSATIEIIHYQAGKEIIKRTVNGVDLREAIDIHMNVRRDV